MTDNTPPGVQCLLDIKQTPTRLFAYLVSITICTCFAHSLSYYLYYTTRYSIRSTKAATFKKKIFQIQPKFPEKWRSSRIFSNILDYPMNKDI